MIEWPDTEILMTRLREWLQRTRAQSELEIDGAEAAGADFAGRGVSQHAVGLVRLVAEFTALRHELKLQTKSARGLEEQGGQAIAALHEAVEAFHEVEADEEAAAEKAAEPLVKALAELDEALERGRVAAENAARVAASSATALQGQLEELAQIQPGWKRWLCRAWRRAVDEACREHAASQRAVLNSLLEGYGLIQGRLDRAMAQADLQRLECVGLPVDPRTMTVVEAVDESGQAPGTVRDEVRPGYLWKGRVLRYAEVRAVR